MCGVQYIKLDESFAPIKAFFFAKLFTSQTHAYIIFNQIVLKCQYI